MKKAIYFMAISALVIGAIFFLYSGSGMNSFVILENFDAEITLYKSPTCGCCGLYHNYFKKQGNSGVELVSMMDLMPLKEDYGVPVELQSCHTTIVGDYFVEGHIPLEAIEKLITEQPDIAGIAMSGMPSGSPGMPGPKIDDFVVYAVNKDKTYEEFMRI